MIKCPSCSQTIPDERQSCPSCGTALEDSFTPTRRLADEPGYAAAARKDSSGRKAAAAVAAAPAAKGRGRTSSSLSSIDDARFIPGTILAERYRIVGLIGRGGMGEVYRADDLKLGQPVALKFLPESLSGDGAALARFHREVRVARQVSHRNVCRVYDIGEVDGHQFLSMEFIKGEELSSLLRRIGRLPADKALEIARQLCAGLAAAHDNGVLHRDLKPANVMLDGDGNVRILDFGLAGLEEEFREDELRAGTPAYMAPEQLDGKDVTVKSDIYSLGLVLYEVFTGKRAFEARSLHELIELRKTGTMPTNPSSHVKELDPLVERVILRCIETDPKERPASALQVAAALPGGDPLAAALAAGETPSPEMVAAAPKEGALRPAVALALLASVFGLFALVSFLSGRVALYRMVPLEKSPEVLRERAREVAKKLGYTNPPTDTAYGIYPDRGYLNYVQEHDASRTRWDKLRSGQPPALLFWYRQSPRYMVASGVKDISPANPPQTISGMLNLLLDTQGQLRLFSAVPPQKEEPQSEERPAATAAADWSALFSEAGFDQASFQPVASAWVPPHAYDTRAAWDGAYPAQPDIRIHVEAAAYRGRPVYFEVFNPWEKPVRQEEQQESASDKVLTIIIITLFLSALIGSALLAVRNLRLGRGDRKGAFRLALFFFAVSLLNWLFDAHHIWSFQEEFLLFVEHVKSGVFQAGFLWLLYIALEPFVRRRWPEGIIAWNRLLAGGFRDPLVGRDILIGALFGVGLILSNYMMDLLPQWLGQPLPIPYYNAHRLLGARPFMTQFVWLVTAALFSSFFLTFLTLLILILLRRRGPTALAVWLLYFFALSLATGDHPSNRLIFVLTGSLITITCLYRYGLLAFISAMFFFHAWVFLPITSDLTAWYAGDFVLALVIYTALALYAFYISLAGQKLFRGGFLQD
ncbi:MAG TPA: protein kinase [Pyrinomonadaceae bacterium]|jgi:serine/threonine-protein kinase|nr:protein kinase [Pyrinomonadaceae bacterium]